MINNKILSKDGATILLAIIFFLMCALAGTTVLAASSVSAGRIANLQEQEQSYYTVLSAARAVRDEVKASDFQVNMNPNYDGGGYNDEMPTIEGNNTISNNKSICYLLLAGVQDIYAHRSMNNNQVSYEKTLTIDYSSSALGLEKVKADFKMDEQYKVTITFYQFSTDTDNAEISDDTYQCTLTMLADVSDLRNKIVWTDPNMTISK